MRFVAKGSLACFSIAGAYSEAKNVNILVVGDCSYGPVSNVTRRKYTLLPIDPAQVNSTLCDPYKRKGLFCGECQEGFGPAVYSFDLHCANCSHMSTATAVSLYLLLELVPITVFFFVVLVFRPILLTGPQLGYVMGCQAIVNALQYSRYIYFSLFDNVAWPLFVLGHVGLGLAGIWNLEFFRFVIPAFCVSEDVGEIHVLMLGFFSSLYPLFLVSVTYIFIELNCFPKKIFDSISIRNSIIHAFSTFTMLSIFSTLCKAYAILQTSTVMDISGNVRGSVLQLDPTIKMWSFKHYPYMVTSLSLVFFLVICPGLFLIVYPTRLYRALSQGLSTRKQLALNIFAETINCGFKDGLNGTRDCRLIPGIMIFCAVIFVVLMSVLPHCGFNGFPPLTIAMIFIVLALCISYTSPCKTKVTNVSLSFHMLLMGVLSALSGVWWQDLVLNSEVLASWIIVLSLFPHLFMMLWIAGRVCERYNCPTITARVARHMFSKLCGSFNFNIPLRVRLYQTAAAGPLTESDEEEEDS